MRANREYGLLDGTLAECDRLGDSQADYSHKHRRHGVNVQVVTDPTGHVLWISPALPGRRCHDLTAARTHRPAPGAPPGADAHPAAICPRQNGRSTVRWPRPERPSSAGRHDSSPDGSSEDRDAARIE